MIASHVHAPKRPARHHLPLAAAAAGLATVIAVAAVSMADQAQAAGPPDPRLGTSRAFSVLAGEGITNTGPTTIVGTLGSAGIQTTVTGSNTITPAGNVLAEGSSVTSDAKGDLLQGYGDAAAAPTVTNPLLLGDIGGLTLTGGTYTRAGSLGFTSTLTLDGENDPNSVFIIQVGTDFTASSSSDVVLTRGAQACHVYWQVGRDAVVETDMPFVGTILAENDISALRGATFQGRLLSNNGAITLDSNTFTSAACAAATSPSSSAPVAPTPTATKKPKPKPTKSTGSGKSKGDRDKDESSDGGSRSGSGSDSDADGDADGTDGAGGTDADSDGSTSTSTGIPNTGGPPMFLAPVGAVVLLAGAGLVFASRRRPGAHRS